MRGCETIPFPPEAEGGKLQDCGSQGEKREDKKKGRGCWASGQEFTLPDERYELSVIK